MNINAATFNYFRVGSTELLARIFLIEPSEVELKTRTLGSSKRKPKLTYEQLSEQAVEAGVSNLYEHAVWVFDELLQKYTTTSGIGFSAALNGGRLHPRREQFGSASLPPLYESLRRARRDTVGGSRGVDADRSTALELR